MSSFVSELRARLWAVDPRYRFRMALDGAVDVKHPCAPATIVMVRRHPHGVVLVATGPGIRSEHRIRERLAWQADDIADDIDTVFRRARARSRRRTASGAAGGEAGSC